MRLLPLKGSVCSIPATKILPAVWHSQKIKKKKQTGLSLVVHWIRICLPMQEAGVRSLVWEIPHAAGNYAYALTACSRAHNPQQKKVPQ